MAWKVTRPLIKSMPLGEIETMNVPHHMREPSRLPDAGVKPASAASGGLEQLPHLKEHSGPPNLGPLARGRELRSS